MTKEEAKKLVSVVRMALEALENDTCIAAIEARAEILAALAQPVQPADLQERFAALHLYEEIAEHYAKTAISPEALRDWVAERMDMPPPPVQRPWVGLTGEDFSAIKFPAEMRVPAEFRAGARWAEAKLKEKNT